jgi:hypothetical protein
MDTLRNRVTALESLTAEQETKLGRSITTAVVVYLILGLVVLAYTVYAGNLLIEMTSPTALKEQFMAYINQVSEQRQNLHDAYRKNADKWAGELVAAAVNCVPLIENHLQLTITNASDSLAQRIEGEILPLFAGALKKKGDDLKTKYKDAESKEIAVGLAGILVDIIQEELDKYVNQEFVGDLNNLQKELQTLANPKAQLTLKQDAQRRIIQYWVFLNEHLPVGESVLSGAFSIMRERWGSSFPLFERLWGHGEEGGAHDAVEIEEAPLPVPAKRGKK